MRKVAWLHASMQGFTLIELMIVVAIIGVIATIAVPNFLTYRNKSRIAAVISSSESIRASLASYSADSQQNRYPTSVEITDLASLRALVNTHGGSLPETPDFEFMHYTRYDTNSDGEDDSYSMRLNLPGMPNTFIGYEVLITPTGISKCTSSGVPC